MAALLAGSSQAAVVRVDLSGSPVAVPATLDGLYLNIATGLTSTGDIPPAGWDVNFYHTGSGLGFFVSSNPGGQGILASGAVPLALAGGGTIGPAGLYLSGQTPATPFLATGVHYAGFRFYNETTGFLNYGWAQFSTTGGTGAGFPANLLAYGYEDSGAPLTAGQIPEPTAPVLLGALAFVGLIPRRRRHRPHAVRLKRTSPDHR